MCQLGTNKFLKKHYTLANLALYSIYLVFIHVFMAVSLSGCLLYIYKHIFLLQLVRQRFTAGVISSSLVQVDLQLLDSHAAIYTVHEQNYVVWLYTGNNDSYTKHEAT